MEIREILVRDVTEVGEIWRGEVVEMMGNEGEEWREVLDGEEKRGGIRGGLSLGRWVGCEGEVREEKLWEEVLTTFLFFLRFEN